MEISKGCLVSKSKNWLKKIMAKWRPTTFVELTQKGAKGLTGYQVTTIRELSANIDMEAWIDF